MRIRAKKITAMLMALVMLLSLMPVSVFAKGVDEPVIEELTEVIIEDPAMSAEPITEPVQEPITELVQETEKILYNVSIDPELVNGTVALATEEASFAEGETVCLTVTPDDGYVLSWIRANDVEAAVSEDVDGEYSFTMPAQDVLVTAEFIAAEELIETPVEMPIVMSASMPMMLTGENSNENYVAMIGDTGYETLAAAVEEANANDTVEIIAANTYTLPSSIPNNITIKGAENLKDENGVPTVVFNCEGEGSIASVSNGATFENVTMNFGQNNYHGFQHAGTINMNNCVLNGKFFSYGVMNFNGCTFNAPTGDYSMWLYGMDVTFTGCTFNGAGKYFNVYNEGPDLYHITATNCTATNSGESNKAVFNVKDWCVNGNQLNREVSVTNCTVDDVSKYPAADSAWDNNDGTTGIALSPFVQVDDVKTVLDEGKAHGITIKLDGAKVYENGAKVETQAPAYTIHTGNDTVQALFQYQNFADDMAAFKTYTDKNQTTYQYDGSRYGIEVYGDIVLTGDVVLPSNVGWSSTMSLFITQDTTIDLNGHTITQTSGTGHSGYALFNVKGGTLTVKDSSEKGEGKVSAVLGVFENYNASTAKIVVESGIFACDAPISECSLEGYEDTNGSYVFTYVSGSVELKGGTLLAPTERTYRLTGESVSTNDSVLVRTGKITIPNDSNVVIGEGIWIPADKVIDYSNANVPEGYEIKDVGEGWLLVDRIIPTVDVGDGKTAEVITQQTSSVGEQNVPEEVKTVIESVKEEIKTVTSVSGVELTTEGENAGLQKIVNEALKDAQNAEAIKAADEIEVKVDVVVTPKAYTENSTLKFDLTPVATLVAKNESGTETAKVEGIAVTNEMINQTQNITVSVFSDFEPKTVLHVANNGETTSYTKGQTPSSSTFTYNANEKKVTMIVHHFSNVLLYNADYVATIGEQGYETLNAAFSAVKTGETINILKNIELSLPARLDEVGTFTIDGNGKTISAANDANFGADGCLCFGQGGSWTADETAQKIFTIKNTTFSGFNTGVHDVIRAEGCSLTIDKCNFQNNTASGTARSGAIVLFTGADAKVLNSKFENNAAQLCIDFNTQGGAANAQTQTNIKVDNCYFHNNNLTGNGVMYLYGPKGSVTNNTFEGNSVTADGAAVIYLSGKADSITNNLFKDNTIKAGGTGKLGVIAFGSSSAGTALEENAFVSNTLDKNGQASFSGTAYVGANNISFERNYWGDGAAPEIGDGKDIYTTKTDTKYTEFATAYTQKDNSNGVNVTLPEKEYVAQILGADGEPVGENEGKYETLAAAIEAAQNNDTVTLLKDCDEVIEKSITASITINGGGKTMSGKLKLDGNGSNNLTVQNFNFETNGLDAYNFKRVDVGGKGENEGNTFTNITGKNRQGWADAILILNAEQALVKGNTIDGADEVGIDIANVTVNVEVANNTVNNTSHNSLQIVTFDNTLGKAEASVSGNTFENWGCSNTNSEGKKAGRAFRGQLETLTFNDNKMINNTAPEEFVKLTDGGVDPHIDVSQNYWNGGDPSGNIGETETAYYIGIKEDKIAELKSYYSDAEMQTLVDLTKEEEGIKTAEEFATALAAGGEIKLAADITYESAAAITIVDETTIDLNGHTLNITTPSTEANSITIPTNTKLTVKDSSANGSGILNVTNTKTSSTIHIFDVTGTLDIQGGTINQTASKASSYGIYMQANGTFNMSGGKLNKGTSLSSKYTLYGNKSTSTKIITGGVIEEYYSNTATSGWTISGGIFGVMPGYAMMQSGKVTYQITEGEYKDWYGVTDGTYVGAKGTAATYTDWATFVDAIRTAESGAFKLLADCDVDIFLPVGPTFNYNDHKFINGHDLKASDENHYITTSSGKYTAVPYVGVKHSDESMSKYETLADAYTNMGATDTIVLLGDITTTSALSIAKSGALDLNGHTLSGTISDGLIKFPGTDTEVSFTIFDSSEGKTGTVNNGSNSDKYYEIYITNSKATVTINGGTFKSTTGSSKNRIYATVGKLIINNGTFNGIIRSSSSSSNITINGGKFNDGISGYITVYDGLFNDTAAGKKEYGVFDLEDCIAEGKHVIANTNDTTKAEYPWTVGEVTHVAQIIGGNEYDTLQEAINAVEGTSQVTIKLLKNANENVTIPAGKNIVLNTNGRVLNGGTAANKATITNNGTLTVIGSGTIKREDVKETAGYYVIDNQGSMTFGKDTTSNFTGTVTNDSGYSNQHKGASVIRNGSDIPTETPATLTIKGGTFEQDNFNVIKSEGYSTISISGGTISAVLDYAILSYDTLTISGGTVNGSVCTRTYNLDAETATNGQTTISNGTITGDVISVKYTEDTVAVPTVTITGGDFYNKNNNTGGRLTTSDNQITTEAPGKFAVSGGNFVASNKPTADQLAEGAVVGMPSGGVYTVKSSESEFGAVINEQDYYPTLAAALDEIKSDDVIRVLKNQNSNSCGFISARKTLSAKEVTINVPEGITLTFSGYGYDIPTGCSLKLTGKGTITHSGSNGGAIVIDGGTVNIGEGFNIKATGQYSSCVFFNFEGGTLTTAGNLKNTFASTATKKTKAAVIQGNGSDNYKDTTINITGGTISNLGTAAIYHPQGGTLNISGGTIEGATGIYVKSGTVNISGGTIKGTGAKESYKYDGSGFYDTGDALVIDNCGYPDGAPVVSVTGGDFISTNAQAVASYGYSTHEAVKGFVSGGWFSSNDNDQWISDDLVASGYKKIADTTHEGCTHKVGVPPVAPEVNKEEVKEASTEQTVVPEGAEPDVAEKVVEEVINEISGNTSVSGDEATNIQSEAVENALKQQITGLVDATSQLKITVKSVATTTEKTTVTEISATTVTTTKAKYDVKPWVTIEKTDAQGVKTTETRVIANDELAAANVSIAFRLAVPVSMQSDTVIVKHYNDGESTPDWSKSYKVQGSGDNRYVELEANSFSVYEIEDLLVQNYVAVNEKTGTPYMTLAAAIEAAADGQTVTLLKDCAENIVETISSSITINGNGNKMTGGMKLDGNTGKDLTVQNFKFETNGLDISGFGEVTVKDNEFMNITGSNRHSFEDAMLVQESGKVTITGNTIDDADEVGINARDISGELIITDNTVKNTAHNSVQIVEGNLSKMPSSATVTGNTFENWGIKPLQGKTVMEGRALRGEVTNLTFTGNVMKAKEGGAPEQYVKLTSSDNVHNIDASGNYWDGLDPATMMNLEDLNKEIYWGLDGFIDEIKSYYADAAKENLIEYVALNLQTEKPYTVLETALSEAEAQVNAETDPENKFREVILLKDLTGDKKVTLVEVAPNVTLDLNGYDLEAKTTMAWGLVKNSASTGKLITAQDHFAYFGGKEMAASDENVMPVWDTNGGTSGYVFCAVESIGKEWKYGIGDSEHNPKYRFQPHGADIAEVLAENSGVKVYVEFTYTKTTTNEQCVEQTHDYHLVVEFGRTFITQFRNDTVNTVMYVSLLGTENVSSISARTYLIAEDSNFSIVSDWLTTPESN